MLNFPMQFPSFDDALEWAKTHARDHIIPGVQRWRVEKKYDGKYEIAIRWFGTGNLAGHVYQDT